MNRGYRQCMVYKRDTVGIFNTNNDWWRVLCKYQENSAELFT
ncbi:unnamed protein product [Tenebrio molitor]|nr:unnamed protein product [Tenebrio molitor]